MTIVTTTIFDDSGRRTSILWTADMRFPSGNVFSASERAS